MQGRVLTEPVNTETEEDKTTLKQCTSQLCLDFANADCLGEVEDVDHGSENSQYLV